MSTYHARAKDGRLFEAVVVNGIPYEVLSATTDTQGDLLAIRRPNGTKTYAARPIADTSCGACRASIVCSLGRS